MSGAHVPDVWPPDTCLECGQPTEPWGPWQKEDVIVCEPCMELYKQELGDPWHVRQMRKGSMEEKKKKVQLNWFGNLLVNSAMLAIVAIIVALAAWAWRVALGF